LASVREIGLLPLRFQAPHMLLDGRPDALIRRCAFTKCLGSIAKVDQQLVESDSLPASTFG